MSEKQIKVRAEVEFSAPRLHMTMGETRTVALTPEVKQLIKIGYLKPLGKKDKDSADSPETKPDEVVSE